MLDSVTLTTLWNRLVSIADQASVAQHRTAFSTVVREANDYACSILDARGDTLATSTFGTPVFLATQSITARAMLEIFPAETLEPGDVLITNDPWIGTGQAMDITILRPIVKRGRLVAFAASVAHAPELGGILEWTRVVTDVYDEALQIPPMKLYRAGELDSTLMTLLRANSRTPDISQGDLEAQLAAVALIDEAVIRVLDEYDLDDLEDFAADIYARSERAMRDVLGAIPDGEYRYDLVSELPGSSDEVTIRTAVRIEGSDLTVDFSGSSAQLVGSSAHSVWNFTFAYTAYALRLITVPYLPSNIGFYRPLTIISPEGSVVNARRPAATFSRHIVGHQTADAVFGALAQVIPERVIAQGGSTPIWALMVTGEDDGRGNPFSFVWMINGGLGALPEKDGETASFPANAANTPAETLEDLIPLRVDAKEMIPDSEGAGRLRGGFGQRIAFTALRPMSVDVLNARVERPPEGLLGGTSGRGGHVIFNGRELGLAGLVEMAPGDQLVIETPGGGGRGLPAERDPMLLGADVDAGLVSAKRARDVYAGAPVEGTVG
jgi:N-methylhydantoinase B